MVIKVFSMSSKHFTCVTPSFKRAFEVKPQPSTKLFVKQSTHHVGSLRTLPSWDCPSGRRHRPSIHWDHSFLLLCLLLLSLQLKVTRESQVWARLPDGWNDGASFSPLALSVEKSLTWVSFSPPPKMLCSSVVGGSFGNWDELLCLVKSPNSLLSTFKDREIELSKELIIS